MNRSIKFWGILGFITVSLSGILLHYLYEFSGKSPIAALISGVNESTWEHMKLLFFSMLFFAVVESFFFTWRIDFFCIKLRSILLGQILIPVIYYTYNGVFGKSPDFVNISIFFVAAAIAFIYETRKMQKFDIKLCFPLGSALILLLIAVLFMVFTFTPPRIPLFSDPITGTYGI